MGAATTGGAGAASYIGYVGVAGAVTTAFPLGIFVGTYAGATTAGAGAAALK